MHGLRCSPGLLGWTRLLDEWVVDFAHSYAVHELMGVGWEDESRLVESLCEAVDRTRRFGQRNEELRRLTPDADGLLRFELQGLGYVVATARYAPQSVRRVANEAGAWLGEAFERAQSGANQENPVGAVFVIPRIPAGDPRKRIETAEEFISEVRKVQSTASAFAFPSRHQSAWKYYEKSESPGALLLIDAQGQRASVSG